MNVEQHLARLEKLQAQIAAQSVATVYEALTRDYESED